MKKKLDNTIYTTLERKKTLYEVASGKADCRISLGSQLSFYQYINHEPLCTMLSPTGSFMFRIGQLLILYRFSQIYVELNMH